MPDLWPEDLGVATDIKPPVAILREQADLLTKKTQGKLEGRITSSGKPDKTFTHQFFITAPALDEYSFRLLSIHHPIDYYPLVLSFDAVNRSTQCGDESEYINVLRDTLADEKTKKIITAILAQLEFEGKQLADVKG